LSNGRQRYRKIRLENTIFLAILLHCNVTKVMKQGTMPSLPLQTEPFHD
jgi:hypothetical protein